MKQEQFDAIVIGSGNGGLMSALTLAKSGKKVLILEKKDSFGGLSSSFKRGRFEFDVMPSLFTGIGSFQNRGEFSFILENLQLLSSDPLRPLDSLLQIYDVSLKKMYVFPVGEEAFIEKMEEYVPSSTESMVTFFGLCEEIHDTYLEISKHSYTKEEMALKFPNFVQLAPCKVLDVFEKIKMPESAQNILSSFWVFLGSFLEDVHFVSFALFLFQVVRYGFSVLENGNYSFASHIMEEFKKSGGEIHFKEEVEEILLSDKKVTGVKTKLGTYESPCILSDVSPHVVYGKLIPKNSQLSSLYGLQNARMFGPKLFTVYLGLNESISTIGLKEGYTLVFPTCDQKTLFKNKLSLFPDVLFAYVKKQDKDTTLLELSSFFFQDSFDKILKKVNYYDLVDQLGNLLVQTFEKSMQISLFPFIEEVEVFSPVTYASYSSHPAGSIYGYLLKGYDNFLPRAFSEDEESILSGLYFCGSFHSAFSDATSTYMDGARLAEKILEGSKE